MARQPTCIHREAETNTASQTLEELFGPPISIYTRAQAIEDGVLVSVPTKTSREAGFKWDVALTAAAWDECVAVPNGCEGLQDFEGRLWDVLWMARLAIRRMTGDANEIPFRLHVVKASADLGRTPPIVELKIHVGPGDEGEPVITIMQPEED